METLQQQLTVVNVKIEAMHQKIEVLSAQIAELLDTMRSNSNGVTATPDTTPANRTTTKASVPTTAHRDILADEDHMALNEVRGKSMSQELQMQRLMAQLTAAYNRIAALEEQLLSQRIH